MRRQYQITFYKNFGNALLTIFNKYILVPRTYKKKINDTHLQ